jgi:regulator of replication initiation timing
MIREIVCREYVEEIERLERSVRELEDEITELRMQLNLKVREATDLAVENANLRHKIGMLRKRQDAIIELLKTLNLPFVEIDVDAFEDLDVSG